MSGFFGSIPRGVGSQIDSERPTRHSASILRRAIFRAITLSGGYPFSIRRKADSAPRHSLEATEERQLAATACYLMDSGNNVAPSADARAIARVREHERTIESLLRIGPDNLTVGQLTQHFAAQVSRVTNIERVKVMRHRPENGDLHIMAGVGWHPDVVGKVALGVDYESPAGRSLQTGSAVAIHNIAEAKEFYLPDVLRAHGIVSLLNVPVMINGLTWGVLEVDSTKPTEFDEWDIRFLTIVANAMGVCLALAEANQKHIDVMGNAARERARFEIVIRELQHRIKNNLQIIIAFLAQKVREFSPDVRQMLIGVIGRVQSVALAHDLLSVTRDPSSVSFDAYLRTLCANIPKRPEISIEVRAQKVSIPLDRAVPAGLIVNELVTNCIKYAFDNIGGHVWIDFELTSNGSEACVAVQDDGKGMGLPPKRGFGLSLVERLADQIQGRVQHVRVTPGTRTVLCFSIPPGAS